MAMYTLHKLLKGGRKEEETREKEEESSEFLSPGKQMKTFVNILESTSSGASGRGGGVVAGSGWGWVWGRVVRVTADG